jgi:hypothetical protein
MRGVALTHGDQPHVFLRDDDGELRRWAWGRGLGLIEHRWGSELAGNPVAVVTGNRLQVFGRGNDSHLHQWTWDPGSGAGWPATGLRTDDWGGSLAGDPCAVVTGEGQAPEVHVFARTSAGRLHHWWGDGIRGQQEEDWGGGQFDPVLAGDPCAVFFGGVLTVLARSARGLLARWEKWVAHAGEMDSSHLRGPDVVGVPTVCRTGDAVRVFARDSAGHLHSWGWGSGEAPFVDEDWGGEPAGDPVAYVTGSGAFHAFARTGEGRLHHWWQDAGGRHDEDWGGQIAEDPCGCSRSDGEHGDELHVFARSRSGLLMHWLKDSTVTAQAHPWGSTFGDVAGELGATVDGDTVHLFGRAGGGDALHHWRWGSGGDRQEEDWGGELAGRPAAIVHPSSDGDVLSVFGLAAGDVPDCPWSLGHWFQSHDDPGVQPALSWARITGDRPVAAAAPGVFHEVSRRCWGEPSALVAPLPYPGPFVGLLQLVYRNHGPRHAALNLYLAMLPDLQPGSVGSWGDPAELAGEPVALPGGRGGIGQEYLLHVFGRDAGGSLHHWTDDVPRGAPLLSETWGGDLAGTPSVFRYAPRQGQQQIHVVGRDGAGRLHHWRRAPDVPLLDEDWGGDLAGEPSAVVIGDQQVVVGRGSRGQLHEWAWTPGLGVIEQDRGGSLAGDPVAVVVDGQVQVCAPDTDGHIRHWAWQPTEDWGGDLAGNPRACVHAGRLHIVGRSSTSGVHHWWWDPGGGRRDEDWGGDLAGDPALCTFGDQLHLFGRDSSGHLRHRAAGPGAVQEENWGGDLAGDPAACAADGHLHVFGRDSTGNLHHWWVDPSGARHDEDLHGPMEGAPSAYLAHDPDRGEGLVVLARNGAEFTFWCWWISGTEPWWRGSWYLPSDQGRYPSPDGDPFGCSYGDPLSTFGYSGSRAGQFHGFGHAGGLLCHWVWTKDSGSRDQVWLFEQPAGSPGSFLAGNPCGFVTGDQLHVFGRDNAARLHHWAWDPGLGLVQQDWGGSLTSDPAAVLHGEQQHVFGRNSNGHLHHWLWDPATGSARPPRVSPAVPTVATASVPSTPPGW